MSAVEPDEAEELVVERGVSRPVIAFFVVEFLLGAASAGFFIEGWLENDLSLLRHAALALGCYWMVHGGWELYTHLTAQPLIQAGQEGIRLFGSMRFFVPWRNVRSIEPAATRHIGPKPDYLPECFFNVPIGAHSRFSPPISGNMRFVQIELADPDDVRFDSPLHKLLFRCQFFKTLYKFNLKHRDNPGGVINALQQRLSGARGNAA